VVPPKVDRPPPPKPAAAARPQPHLSLPEPIRGTSTAQADAPAVDPPHEDVEAAPAGTGTAEAPVVQAAPPPPAPVVQAKEGANYLKNPRPGYPRLAQREGWEGSVLLRVRVLPNGRSEAISVLKSSGRTVLDNAAIEAVQGWTFVPATQGGNAIAGWVNVPIEFRLQ
jgi:protein TonB